MSIRENGKLIGTSKDYLDGACIAHQWMLHAQLEDDYGLWLIFKRIFDQAKANYEEKKKDEEGELKNVA